MLLVPLFVLAVLAVAGCASLDPETGEFTVGPAASSRSVHDTQEMVRTEQADRQGDDLFIANALEREDIAEGLAQRHDGQTATMTRKIEVSRAADLDWLWYVLGGTGGAAGLVQVARKMARKDNDSAEWTEAEKADIKAIASTPKPPTA